MSAPRHVHDVYIRAAPGEVWRAIVDPAFTSRYFDAAAFDGMCQRLFGKVEGADLVARLDEVGRHAAAHVAEADESDAHG